MNNKKENEKYLPIGSVVLLKDAVKNVMITGYSVVGDDSDEVFDYLGCLWPEGIISTNRNILFNHESIEKVLFLGYSNDETKVFMRLLKRAVFINTKTSDEDDENSESSSNEEEEED